MYDMLTWFRNPNWQTSHLEGVNLAGKKVIQHCFDSGKALVYSKTNTGNPWDVKAYDNTWIYDMITEANTPDAWTNPRNYKKNGWPICPRLWDGDPTYVLYNQTAPWVEYVNCTYGSSGDVGPVWYTLQGPYIQDFGGNVGVRQTILLTYYWASGHHREQLFLTQTHGWVKWTHAVMTSSGMYVIDSVSNHNVIVPGTVKPNFTCFQIP